MLGNDVHVICAAGEPIKGVLQKLDQCGATVSVWNDAGRAWRNVFIPMARIIHIEDQGARYR